MPTLESLCTVLRAKNAGPFYTTLDLFFVDRDAYRRVVDGGLLTPEVVAERYPSSPAWARSTWRRASRRCG
jgi:hypothetical protein